MADTEKTETGGFKDFLKRWGNSYRPLFGKSPLDGKIMQMFVSVSILGMTLQAFTASAIPQDPVDTGFAERTESSVVSLTYSEKSNHQAYAAFKLANGQTEVYSVSYNRFTLLPAAEAESVSESITERYNTLVNGVSGSINVADLQAITEYSADGAFTAPVNAYGVTARYSDKTPAAEAALTPAATRDFWRAVNDSIENGQYHYVAPEGLPIAHDQQDHEQSMSYVGKGALGAAALWFFLPMGFAAYNTMRRREDSVPAPK